MAKGRRDQVKRTPEEWAVINEERRKKDIFALDHLRAKVVQVKSFGGGVFLSIFNQADYLSNQITRAAGQVGGVPVELVGPLNEEFNDLLLRLDDWCVRASKVARANKLVNRGYVRPDAVKRYYEMATPSQQPQATTDSNDAGQEEETATVPQASAVQAEA